ncbi:EAL domain-containing protein [Massilia sp. AB1]|uniref:EAL domain-containing protein n=1 Tax=Massilia sp. AB1 TaxID=2823371 RepID=UPI001B8170D4|nr:EAL domain-containing protein [Massilia sp. AB1]
MTHALAGLRARQPAILLACLLPALWLVAAAFLQHVREQALVDAGTDTGNLARIMAEETQSSVRAVERTLVDLRERWLEEPANFAGKLRLRQSQLDETTTVWISILDADGRLVFTNRGVEAGKVDLSDRDYFTALRDATRDRLTVSEPLTGRVSGRRGIVFARPVIRNGRFAGVIALSVAPDYFLRFSHKIVLGNDSVILLAHAGGQVLARSPAPPDGESRSMDKAPFIEPAAPLSGVFRMASPIDGLERQYAWHSLPQYGLTLAIGRSLEAVLAPYYRVRQAAAWSTGILTLVLVWTAWVMLRGLRERDAARQAAEQAAREAQAAESLFRSDQRFGSLADAMPQIVWTAEPDGVVDYANDLSRTYSGQADLFGPGQGWTRILHPDDIAPTLAAWRAAVDSGEVFETEYRIFRAADSSYRWHRVRAMPIRDDGGAIVKWYGSATDHHDSKLANDRIARLAASLGTILESITDAYYSLDAEWRFTYVNKEAERLLNRTRESLLGKSLWDEYPELVGSMIEQEYRRAAGEGNTVAFEFFYAPSAWWFAVRVSPSSEGVTVYFDDITERRRLRVFKDEQTRLLEQIAAGAMLLDVLEAAAHIIAASDPLAGCAVMLLGENGERLHHAVASGLPEGLGQALDGTPVGEQALPCGRAALARRPVIAADMRGEPAWQDGGPAALAPAVRACWSYPILSSSGEVFGTIDVYTQAARPPVPVELEILGSCAHTISIAIGRERAEHQARQSEERLRLKRRALEASANPIVIRSAQAPDYPVEYVNPAFERVTGYPAAEAIGKSLVFLLGDDREQEAIAELDAALAQQREGHAAVRTYRPDGSLVWMECYCSPVRDAGGKVTHFLNVMYDISAARQYQAELEYQAHYDAVTGLAKRSLLAARAGAAIARAVQQGSCGWLACVNLDRFKLVNETLGHQAGDMVLQRIGQRVQGLLAAGDTAARVGGDELMLLFADGMDEETVLARVERIQEAIAAPLPVNGQDYFLSSSVGLAAYPDDGEDAETLMKNARVAMRRAKEARSNHPQFFTAAMNADAGDRLRLERDLRHALERGELLLHFQPQVDARTCRIVGMEALLRWRHPELGMVAPDRFIRIAEETGLIVPIGAWVMRTACAHAKQWQWLVPGQLRVAVNLAASQLYHDDLVGLVGRTLADTGLDADCLDIELTESQVMADVDHALDVMQRLKAMGVKLSLDDFGTGYSSLSYLKRFPIDVLKIDKSFVRNLTTDADDAVIARSIITLGQSLQLQVIAEGVETEEQFAYLRRHRCDQIQGYYFSRPLAAEDFERLLAGQQAMPQVAEEACGQPTLLIVDDEENVAASLHRLLRRDGYRILRAKSGAEGLALLAMNQVQVVLSDERMPGMSGTEFLARVKAIYPDTIRIMLSGYTAVDAIIAATNSGSVFRFHAKPWDDEAMRASIAEAFRYHWLINGNGLAHAASPPAKQVL